MSSQVPAASLKHQSGIPESLVHLVGTFDYLRPFMSNEATKEKITKLIPITQDDAESVMWLVWRARVVCQFYAKLTWAEALHEAWTYSSLFKEANEMRKSRNAERQARAERLNAAIDNPTGAPTKTTMVPPPKVEFADKRSKLPKKS